MKPLEMASALACELNKCRVIGIETFYATAGELKILFNLNQLGAPDRWGFLQELADALFEETEFFILEVY